MWREKPILLPDSMGGIGQPEFITWNPANNLVYVGSRTSPRVVAFDAGTRTRIAVIDLGRPVTAVCANAAENKVYAALMSNATVAVIDGKTNSVVNSIKLKEWDVDRLCLNPAENKLYCQHSDWGEVTVVDCRTDAVTAVVPVGKSPSALACDSSSGVVFCANKGDGTVSVIDGATDSVRCVVQVGSGPQALCPVPSAAKVYCANGLDSTVSVIDCSTMSVRATIRVGNGPEDLCYVPGVHKVYCANSGYAVNLRDSTVTAIDCSTDSVVATVNVYGAATKVVWWPPGENVFAARASSDIIYAVDPRPDSVVYGVYVGFGVHSFAYASDERDLFCTSDYSGTVTGILSREPQYAAIRVGTEPNYLCVNPNHDKLYCTEQTDEGARIAVIARHTGEVIGHIEAPCGGWLCYNTRNDKLYWSGNSRDTVCVIDGVGDTIVAELPAGPGPLGLCYDSVSNRVYCANIGGGTMTVFDGSSDTVVATIAVTDGPHVLAYAPDIHRIFYTSWARKGLWAVDCESNRPDTSFHVDVDNENFVLCYNPDDQRVYFAEFGSDGDRILAADAKGRVREVAAIAGWPSCLCYDQASGRLFCTYGAQSWYGGSVYNTKVGVIDWRKGDLVADLDPEPGAWFLTADAGNVYAVNSWASSISVLEQLPTVGKTSPTPCVVGRVAKLTGLRDGTTVASVYDLSGRLRTRQELTVSKGETAVTLSGLPAGVYYVLLDRNACHSYKVVYLK